MCIALIVLFYLVTSNITVMCSYKDWRAINDVTMLPQVLSRKDLSPVEKDDILFALLSSADLYHKHPEYFDMFGSYKGHPNVLFSVSNL